MTAKTTEHAQGMRSGICKNFASALVVRRCVPMLISLLAFAATTASGQAQQIQISTDFAGGNVIIVENAGATVRLKPDLRGGRDWFYWNFQATAAQAGEVEFVFEGKLRIGVRGPAASERGS